MTTITTHELPTRLAAVFAGLASGEEFLVTADGHPVAGVLPPETVRSQQQETAADWVARCYAWTDSQFKRDIVIDDSRGAIYDGCRE